jgi:hypothetical protein
MLGIFKKKRVASTPFSDFIREASSEEKKRVYSAVLRRATESQTRVLERAERRRAKA